VNYLAAGRLAKAVELLEGAHRLRREYLGPDHPDTLISRQSLARACEADGRPADAEAHLREVVAAYRRRPDPADLVDALGSLGMTLTGRGKFAEAEAILREALALCEKKDPDAWATAHARSLLGAAVLGQRRYADAEPLLTAGYEGMLRRAAKVPPVRRARLAEAADRLVELYAAWGKPAEAARWRAERAKYPPPTAPPPREVTR